jgi:hypothetical protein
LEEINNFGSFFERDRWVGSDAPIMPSSPSAVRLGLSNPLRGDEVYVLCWGNTTWFGEGFHANK